MPFSSLVTSLRVDLTELHRGLQQAERDMRRYHQVAQQLSAVRLAGPVTGGTRTVGGAASRVPGGRAGETVEQAGQRFLLEAYRDAGRQVREDARQRAAQQRALDREEERIRRQVLREQARVAIQQGFATPLGAAGRQMEQQRLEGRFREDARRARIARGLQQAEERQAAQITRELGLPSRAQDAQQRARVVRDAAAVERQRRTDQQREFTRQSREFARDLRLEDQEKRSRFAQAARIAAADQRLRDRQTREQRRGQEGEAAHLTRFFGLPSRAQAARGGPPGGGPPGGAPINPNLLAGAFNKATQAANALGLITNVSLLGGFAGLVAEGFRLNAVMERINLTMAATLATTNDVVDAQGKLVEGPERTNFLLQGTAGLYDQIRKEAASTILEQQELMETVGENLTLAQQAGFKLTTLGGKQTEVIVKSISQIAQLAKAVGLPGGQRQLSQEVRALFLGERLQGATVARLLGFSDINVIKKLQARPGRQEGTTAFVDELTKRFERAKPILDKFAESATGIFTTLVSQVRLFLQVASESAFKEIVGTARNLREFLSDERVKSSAQEIGRSFGQLVRGIVDFGRAISPVFAFFRYLVNHAREIIVVVSSLALLSKVQGVSTAIGGRAAGAAVGGAAGQAAGTAGGVAAGGLLARLGAARVAGGAAAGAARLGTLGTLAGGALALGAAPAAAIAGSLLGGLGIGTGLRFLGQGLPEQLGQRFAGVKPPGEFVKPEKAELVEPILRVQAQRRALEDRQRAFRERGAVARQGQPELTAFERFAVGVPSITDVLSGSRIADRFRKLQVPALTERVTERGVSGRIAERKEEEEQLRTTAQEAARLELRRQEQERRDQRLKAKLALAEVNRDREAALKIQAKLDQESIVTEFTDQKARAIRLKALEKQLRRDLRELREDEALQNREIIAQGLNDEVEIARIRAQRAENEAKRRIRDERELAKVLAGVRLGAQREILGAQIGRQERRLGAESALAGAEGRTLDVIRNEGRQRLLEAAKLRVDLQINDEQFDRFHTAIIKETARKEIEARRQVRDQAIDFATQVTDIARRSSELQRDFEEQRIRFAEGVRDRERALNRSRLAEINQIADAQRAAREAREDIGQSQAEQALRRRAFEFLTTGGEANRFLGAESIQEAVRSRITDQLRGQGVGPGERGAVAGQRTQEFLRGLLDTLLGGGGVEGAVGQLQELGIQPTFGIRRQLAGFAAQAGTLQEQQRVRQFSREDLALQERGIQADQQLAETQDQRRETELQNRRAVRDEGRERQRIGDDFRQAQAALAIEFGRTQIAIQEFARQAKEAGIALDAGLTAVFRKFLGARVPAPEAAVAGEAQRQLERAGAPRRRGETPPANQRSDAGSVFNLNIGQLGADTKKTLEELGEKLIRDARRVS